MASTAELRRLLAIAKRQEDCARRYGGARYEIILHMPPGQQPPGAEVGLLIEGPDFSTSSEPDRYWSRMWDEHCRAGANIARARASTAATAWEREDAQREAAHYESMSGAEAHIIEGRLEQARMAEQQASAHERAVAAPENRPPLAPEPKPAPAPIVPRTGAELDFMDKSSAPALPPRRRSRVTRARTEPTTGGGGLTGRLVRG